MTTEFLDNKNCNFKILLSWRFPRKTAFWTIFRSAPRTPPPSKSEKVIFIVVSPSLKYAHATARCPLKSAIRSQDPPERELRVAPCP